MGLGGGPLTQRIRASRLSSAAPAALACALQAPDLPPGQESGLEVGERARIEALADRCARAPPWASHWIEAAERATEHGQPVLAVVHFLPAFSISPIDTLRGLLDEDVLELVRERFVPVLLRRPGDSPLAHRELYGMGPSSFGTSLIVATAEGDVLADTLAVSEQSFLLDFLREALARHEERIARTEDEGATRPGAEDAVE